MKLTTTKSTTTTTTKPTTRLPTAKKSITTTTTKKPITPPSVVVAPTAAHTALTLPECRIPDLDPFDKSVAKYFNYKPYSPCAKWVSPFQVRPPNHFYMKPHRLSFYQKNCQYNTLEGQKFKEESEKEPEGPTVTFAANQEVTVNASVVR